jgi:hypothetical protein
MGFKEFWPLYLQAHRRPATRACHYLATAAGMSAAVVAPLLRDPWIFLVTVVICYTVAIASHRFIERNSALILMNPAWGAVADVRMTWLAATGRLDTEYARHNVAAVVGLKAGWRFAARGQRMTRYAPFVISAAGLLIGLADLQDIIDPDARLIYPVVQLGAPIAVFASALAAAWVALLVDRIETRGAPIAVAARRNARLSVLRVTFRRVAVCLAVIGASAFAAGEVVELGFW